MKTILRINHMDILLPEGANVTQLLKTFSKSKEARNNYAISKVVQEKVKPS